MLELIFPLLFWISCFSVQMCCDCCMLGLMAASSDSRCELGGLLLGKQCAYTAHSCCGSNTTKEIKPSAEGEIVKQSCACSLLCPDELYFSLSWANDPWVLVTLESIRALVKQSEHLAFAHVRWQNTLSPNTIWHHFLIRQSSNTLWPLRPFHHFWKGIH